MIAYRQWIRWSVSALLVSVILSGCVLLATPTSTPPPNPTPAPTASPETVTPTPAPSPTVADGLMTISIWVPEFLTTGDAEAPEGSDAEALTVLDRQLNTFAEDTPQTTVRIIPKKPDGSGGLYDLFSTAAEAAPSILPDVIMLDTGDLNAAAASGLIQPVGVWLPAESDLYPFALESVTYDFIPDEEEASEIWAFPYLAHADHVAYRRGISAAPPLSWTRVLTSTYSVLFPAAPPDDLASDVLVAAYIGSGGRVMDEAGRPALDRAVLEDLYAFFAALRSRELINVDRALSLTDAGACWEVYTQGIGRLSPVPMGIYWADPPADSLAGWMPTDDGSPATVMHPWHLAMVTDDPERQDQVLNLIQWLTQPDNVGAVAGSVRAVPVRRQALETWLGESEEAATADRILSTGIPPLPPSVNASVRRALQAGLAALYRAEVESPEEAVDFAVTRLRP